jgi:hypothetical protein
LSLHPFEVEGDRFRQEVDALLARVGDDNEARKAISPTAPSVAATFDNNRISVDEHGLPLVEPFRVELKSNKLQACRFPI